MVVAPDLPMTTKVYDASGGFLTEFPYWTSLACMDCINSIPSFTMSYPLNAKNAFNLISDSDIQIAVCMDARDNNGYQEVARYFYEQDDYDVSMPESATVQASGRGIIVILRKGLIYPQGGVGSKKTSWSFSGTSWGSILNTFITAAQARGCFPSLTTSFTSGSDSAGNAWAHGFTGSFDAGTNLLDLVTTAATNGLIDVKMTGMTLNVYNPGTFLATDRSSSVILRRGQSGGIETIPAQRDRTTINTVMLAIGDNGLNVERTASTYGALGRSEGYLAQAGITDAGTLNYWADQALGAVDDQKFSLIPTYVCDVSKKTPIPWKDYFPGDYISLDQSGTPIKYRASQFAVQCSAGGPTQVQPTLNDIFYDLEAKFQGQITGLNNGSITSVGSTVPDPGPNSTVPGVPTFITASFQTAAYYSPATGTTLAQVELAWSTPLNTDTSVMIDGSQYIIQYRLSSTPIYPLFWSQVQGKPWSTINGNPWTNVLDTPQNQQWTTLNVGIDNNSAMITGLICGESYDFQIACTDVSGNTGVFSATTSYATARDTVAPVQPDAPSVSASMVAVQVMHDLGSATGGSYNLAQDLDHLEVHYSYDPSFVAVAGVGSPTYLGKLIANAGMMQAQIAAVGTFQVTSVTGIYIRVIAVDVSGNTSPSSPSSGVTAVLIDDQHISSLNVSKLVAGTISATIILGGTIATSLTGQRCVMDSSGFHSYDANGNLLFDVRNNSSQVILGAIGGVGKVVIDTNPADVYPQIRFYDQSNTNYAFILGSNLNGNTAGIALSSGTYQPGATLLANRLTMDGFGCNMEVIDATNQNILGGSVLSSPQGVYANCCTESLVDGGSLTLEKTDAIFGLFPSGATHGGQLRFDYDSTNSDATWQFDGYYPAAFAPAPQEALVGTRFTGIAGGLTSISVGYGATMYSTMAPIVTYSCSTTGVIGGNLNGNTTTGFTYTLSGAAPGLWNVHALSIRVR